MKRIISGIQPSGSFHIGNYASMIFKEEDSNNKIYIPIVDLHAMTTIQNSTQLKEYIYLTSAVCLAIFNNATVFLQSSVLYHDRLSWILSCFAKMNELERMTQFKEKKTTTTATLGLFSYPVLMCADIMLYFVTHVKVGDDQIQHIELLRDLIRLFNSVTGANLYIPEIILQSKRIMSLTDPTKKMSKSGDPNGTIGIMDDADTIAKKIQKAKTDSTYISEDTNGRKELENLNNIAELFGIDIKQFIGSTFSAFKKHITGVLIEELTKIQSKVNDLLKDRENIKKILIENGQKMHSIAENNIQKVPLFNLL